MFFEDLLLIYSKINFPEQYLEISKADKAISWYLADSTDQFVTVSKQQNMNIVEIDIRQAFTSICRCIFNPTDEFIIQMNQIEDKKSRNIFIATSLVNTEYLRMLNVISKVIVCGVLFEIGDITLLELKKDGAIVSCDSEVLDKIININDNSLKETNPFLKFVLENKFEFHTSEYERYLRSNRTSYFLTDKDELIVKGIYKHSPPYINCLQTQIIQNNFDNFSEMLQIYSKEYLKILLTNNLNELLNEYYICSNKRYLAEDGKYVIKGKDENVDPRNYIKTFIYPIILSTKL